MNEFTNPDGYVTKSHASNCRDCGQVFIVNTQYDKNGVPVSFISKYCHECNAKLSLKNTVMNDKELEIEALKKENAELKEKIECLNIIVETLREVNTKVIGHNKDFKQIREHLEQKEKDANKADWWKKED
jgi:hypothetical protein